MSLALLMLRAVPWCLGMPTLDLVSPVFWTVPRAETGGPAGPVHGPAHTQPFNLHVPHALPHVATRYEVRLLRYLEELIRQMDRKIATNKERAEKESMPRAIRAEDQVRLSELQARAKGGCQDDPARPPCIVRGRVHKRGGQV